MKRIGIITFLIALAVWCLFAWPLPRFFSSAIPAGTVRPSFEYSMAPMEPGDHLQLLYHFWLFSDFVAGKTPWFHNLYELNTGDDSARVEPGSYYFPFSLFFAVGSGIHGNAFGWNLTGLLSLWFSFFFTCRLARRYSTGDGWALLVSLISITLPYRWISMNGGSPTGFAMMWVPALLLGLDLAVRDHNWRGGLLAGVALLMASWGDPHVFFFSGLVTPCWCVIAFLFCGKPDRKMLKKMAVALIPVPVFAAVALWSGKLMTRGMASSYAEGGRALREVALFSPRAFGLFSWHETGVSHHVYLGWAVTALLVSGLILFAMQFRRQKRRALAYGIIMLGIVVTVLLALGPFAPSEGWLFNVVRDMIPQYRMIRQPAKIFCLLPSFLAVAGALITALVASRFSRVLLAGLLIAGVFEFKAFVMPVLCTLDSQQSAYRAVAETDTDSPRAMVIPLWPGDSHYTSVYQYYAMLYRIRLVNGYRAFVPKEYMQNIGRHFECANLGWLGDAHLDELLAMGVRSLILHEDLFPEKVSPFPVGFTLVNLLRHPRLRLLAHDGTVWAFRIEEKAVEKIATPEPLKYLFPGRITPLDKMKKSGEKLWLRSTQAVYAPGMRWMIRARGTNTITCETFIGDKSAAVATILLSGRDWQWVEAPLPAWDGMQMIYPLLRTGSSEIDCIMLAGGDEMFIEPGGKVELPAACFFHAGFTDLTNDAVVFRKDHERRDIVFYGPKMPFEPGMYRVRVDFASDAPAGTALGYWLIACPEEREISRCEVVAGHPLEMKFRITENLPLYFAFHYYGRADMSMRSVILEREN